MSDKKLQAKHLFFQTELNKTQIAELLNISRRTLHYWIKEGNWERLKRSAEHMPSIIAENCYHLLDKLTCSYLSERRLSSPATPREIDALHKLTLTINKLKGRAVLNENVEMFAYFLDKLKAKAPEVAKTIAPFVDEYLGERANMYTTDPDILPPGFTQSGYIPMTTETEVEKGERLKDGKDLHDWDYEAYWQQQLATLDKPEPPLETPEVLVSPFGRHSFSYGGHSFSDGTHAEPRDYLSEYITKKEKLTGMPIPSFALPAKASSTEGSPAIALATAGIASATSGLAKLKNENMVSRLTQTGRRGGNSSPWAETEQYLGNRKSKKMAQSIDNQKRSPMTDPKNFFPIKVSSIRFSTPPMVNCRYVNGASPIPYDSSIVSNSHNYITGEEAWTGQKTAAVR